MTSKWFCYSCKSSGTVTTDLKSLQLQGLRLVDLKKRDHFIVSPKCPRFEPCDPYRFNCNDCGVDTAKILERYVVKNDVWAEANGSKEMLCIGCLEKRLGRILTFNDFTDAPLNLWKDQSLRLKSRLKGLVFKRGFGLYMIYKKHLKSNYTELIQQ